MSGIPSNFSPFQPLKGNLQEQHEVTRLREGLTDRRKFSLNSEAKKTESFVASNAYDLGMPSNQMAKIQEHHHVTNQTNAPGQRDFHNFLGR